MSSFTESLIVSPLSDGKTWVLQRSFGYYLKEEGGETVTVVSGFMTDFASIPRIFWIILPKWGKYGNAAVVHDWNYWIQTRTRKESDDLMNDGMKVLKVPGWQRLFIYGAVRTFGWFAWVRNKWDREAGFIRVDPKVSLNQPKMTEPFKRPTMRQRALDRLTGKEKPKVEEEKKEEELEAASV